MFKKALLKLNVKKGHVQTQLVPPPTPGPSKNAFQDLKGFRQLVSVPTGAVFMLRKAYDWQMPLPYDIILTIVGIHLHDSVTTIRNMSLACYSLSTVCRPFLFHTVTLQSPARQVPTAAERFALLLSSSPHLLIHIQTLRIIDNGQMFAGSRPITAEEESLCFILTRHFPNLQHLELSLHVVWTLLPMPLQYAFELAFASTSLRRLTLHQIRVNVDIFRFMTGLHTLEMFGEASLPVSGTITNTKNHCYPVRLVLKDESRTGFVTTNLCHEQSALRLTELKGLVAYLQGDQVLRIKDPLELCVNSLRTLELRIWTSGHGTSS